MGKDWFLREGVFQVGEGFLLGFTPLPGGVFAYEIDEGTCDFRKVFYEAAIIISETEELSDTFDVDGGAPGLDHVNLFLGHMDALIGDVHADKLYLVRTPYAFFRFEKEVVVFQYFEDLLDH